MSEVSQAHFTQLVDVLEDEDHLHLFYHELGIPHKRVASAEQGVRIDSVKLRAYAVLNKWKKENGKKLATLKAILEALWKCKFTDAIEDLQEDEKSDDWKVEFDHLKSTSDFTRVIEVLGSENLALFFNALGIHKNIIDKAELGASTTNVDLKAMAVLLTWQQQKGKAANRKAMLTALKECNTNAFDECEAFWPDEYAEVAGTTSDDEPGPSDRHAEKRKNQQSTGSPKRKRGSQTGVSRGHVMISYQWDAKERMLKLRDELEKAGFKVWIDEQEMEGNMHDRMAEAVENASVILVCFSKKYKESKNCKKEAQYAHEKSKHIIPLKYENYTPDGWLGLILTTELYYDVRTDRAMMKSLPKIIQALDKQGVSRQAGTSASS